VGGSRPSAYAVSAVTPTLWQPRGVRTRPSLIRGAALLVAALVAVACSGPDEPEVAPLRVVASEDGEGRLLAGVLVALLDTADIDAEVRSYADARDGQQALELGAADVRAGYTGEAWLETLGRADPPGDPEASFAPVRADGQRRGIVWLPPRFTEEPEGPPANATFALAVAGPPSPDADLRTVSQLAARLSERVDASVCVDREFGSRSDGLRAVLDAYLVPADQPFLAASPEEAVRGVVAGDCLAGLTTASDGAAGAAGLQVLVDDLEVFPAFVPAVQVRAEVLDERPEIGTALDPFGQELTTSLLRSWNARLVTGEPLEQVAREAADELLARAEARRTAPPAEEDPDAPGADADGDTSTGDAAG
jgi:osmoprotectant transport system substrate-binding protein